MDFDVEDVEMLVLEIIGGGGIILLGFLVCMEGCFYGFGFLVIMGCDGIFFCV